MPPVLASSSHTSRKPSPGSESCRSTESDSRGDVPVSARVPLVTWSPSGWSDDVRADCAAVESSPRAITAATDAPRTTPAATEAATSTHERRLGRRAREAATGATGTATDSPTSRWMFSHTPRGGRARVPRAGSAASCWPAVRTRAIVARSPWQRAQVATWRRVSSSEEPAAVRSRTSGSGCDIVHPQVVAELGQPSSDVALDGPERESGAGADLAVREPGEEGELHHRAARLLEVLEQVCHDERVGDRLGHRVGHGLLVVGDVVDHGPLAQPVVAGPRGQPVVDDVARDAGQPGGQRPDLGPVTATAAPRAEEDLLGHVLCVLGVAERA